MSAKFRHQFLAHRVKQPTPPKMYKAVVFAALVAVANAGLLGAPLAYSAPYASPALVSQQSNILRTPGNLGQVSTYSKTISTPYSSVSKSDVRVSNDALVAAHAPVATYAAPAVASYAAPAVASYAAPALASYAAPAYAAAPAIARVAAPASLGVAYSAAPVVSHVSFDGLGAHYVL